jgi:UDPglucose 6-dehydrogenase
VAGALPRDVRSAAGMPWLCSGQAAADTAQSRMTQPGACDLTAAPGAEPQRHDRLPGQRHCWQFGASVKAHAVAEAGRGLPPVPPNVVGEITSLVARLAPVQAYGRDVDEVGMREKESQNQDEEPERVSRLAVIGAGHVGLVTSATLAHLGHDVCCADIVPEKVATLSRGEIPMVEPGLDQMVREELASGRLRFVLGASAAVSDREFVFLCLPTPELADGSADMASILEVAREIGPQLPHGSIVINKSTVPVGSTHAVQRALARGDVAVVSNPEFLREGTAIRDCQYPDRIVIGGDDYDAAMRVAHLYHNTNAPVMVTRPSSAEAIKYASNAFLATKLSFINSLACLCESIGAEFRDVIQGMGYDRRIGLDFVEPGPGWGGSCLPKDTRALIRISEDAGYDFSLLRCAIAANEEHQDRIVAKIEAMVGGALTDITVAAWGLTFKAGTDDRRHSPAIAIINRLARSGARVRAYDPTVRQPLPGMDVCLEPYGPCRDASVLVVLTEWDELRRLNFDKIGSLMASPCIVDARNLLDPETMRHAGFRYQGVGRP